MANEVMNFYDAIRSKNMTNYSNCEKKEYKDECNYSFIKQREESDSTYLSERKMKKVPIYS